MTIGDKIKSGMGYAGDLADTGWKGAREAGTAALNGEKVTRVLGRSAQDSWAATLVGAAVGALVGYLVNTKKPSISRVAACAVLGGTVGFGTGLAWETRDLSSGIARGAMRNINKVRDQHWLASHPIDFGYDCVTASESRSSRAAFCSVEYVMLSGAPAWQVAKSKTP